MDAMMAENESERKRGDMILNNYKRQITERMAREKVDSYDQTAATATAKKPSHGKSVSNSQNSGSSQSVKGVRMGPLSMNIKENMSQSQSKSSHNTSRIQNRK